MKTCLFLPSSQSHLAGCWSSSRLPQTEQSSEGASHASQNELTADRFSKNTNSDARQSSVSLLLSLVYQSWATASPGHKEPDILVLEHGFCQLRSEQPWLKWSRPTRSVYQRTQMLSLKAWSLCHSCSNMSQSIQPARRTHTVAPANTLIIK